MARPTILVWDYFAALFCIEAASCVAVFSWAMPKNVRGQTGCRNEKPAAQGSNNSGDP